MPTLTSFLSRHSVSHIVVAASATLTFRTSCDGAYSGQVDNTLSAYQGDTRVGYIQYSVYKDTPSVNYIKVEPEFRRQGIGTKLLKQLQREFPDTEIGSSGLTTDGAALRKSVPTTHIANPRVQELKAELDALHRKLDSYSKLADAHRNKTDKTDADYEQFIKSVEDWNELSDRADDIEHELATMPTGKTLISTAAEDIPDMLAVDGTDRPTRNSDNRLIHPTIEGIENFWRWFGESVTVTHTGRPVVYYHGTNKDVSSFEPNAALGGCIFLSPDADYSGLFAKYLGGNIMPVYVRALSVASKVWDARDEVKAASVSKSRKRDGFYLSDKPGADYEPVNLAVFASTQIKSATGNNGEFSPTTPVVTASC